MDSAGIEQSLRQYGFYASSVEGMSMYPMLHPRQDTVLISEMNQEPCPGDVVLYRVPGGQYVLHRLLKAEKEYDVICGDNCVKPEYIPREYVIGRLVLFYRQKKKIELTDRGYRLYVALWCRPWRLRIALLKGKHFFKRVWRRLHEIK